jgi:thiol:disulfide interchange protein DsbD
MRFDIPLLASLLCVLAAAGRAAGATGPHGTVDLIAEPASVRPGRPFSVGLLFRLEPGWHIYWINPGDSGEPPRVKWSLPAGFTAGPIEWPLPHRIEDHSLVDYGFQDQVLLPVEITPPAGLGKGAGVQLNATVNWLVCRDICVPGRAALALTLPIGNGTPGQTSHSLFVQARAKLPRPAPPSWKVIARLDKQAFVLNVDTGKKEAGATFFPLTPNQIENAAPQKVSPSARGVRVEMAKSDQLLKPPAHLAGVLVLASGLGYRIEAPVIASP